LGTPKVGRVWTVNRILYFADPDGADIQSQQRMAVKTVIR
jgi:hypothetical protein